MSVRTVHSNGRAVRIDLAKEKGWFHSFVCEGCGHPQYHWVRHDGCGHILLCMKCDKAVAAHE